MANFADARWAIVQAITNRNPNRSLVYGDLVFKRAGRCIMSDVAGHPVTQHAWTRAGIRFDGQRRFWHCCRACWEFATAKPTCSRCGLHFSGAHLCTADHKPSCAIRTTRAGWDADCTCNDSPEPSEEVKAQGCVSAPDEG